MKKQIAKSLVVLMAAVSLWGCGNNGDTSTTQADNAASETTESADVVKVIDVELTSEEYAFGVDKNQPELLSSVNDYIKEIKENGEFDAICNKYFGDGEPEAVTSAALDTSKDQLVIATNAAFEPFEYTKGDSYYGIDMEIADGLAKKLGKELVIQNMDFDAVCLSVGQHKSDIAASGLTIKEDRKEYVDFSDAYYSASQKLVVRSDNTEFDSCTDKESVEAILNQKDSSTKVGVQNGTTGQFYCEGDKDWGFDGFKMTTTGYKNGSLAVQDLINNNIDLVIIDSAPARCIADAFNEMN
jgi:polar amino acid transport system substrate-binding protein